MTKRAKKIREFKGLEMKYIMSFAIESCFDVDVLRDHLRSLWIAYCLHNDLTVDMPVYRKDISELWGVVSCEEPDTADWSDFDSFDKFMSRCLV